MISRALGRMLIVVVLLTLITAVPLCIVQRQRARNEIAAVSERFVRAASKLDLSSLRECITDKDRASMPAYYACIAARKLSELNKDVRTSVRTEVTGIKTGGGEANVRIKRFVVEQGTRLRRPVRSRIADECTVVCVYDGKRWLVDLHRTLKDERFPVGDIALFRECLTK